MLKLVVAELSTLADTALEVLGARGLLDGPDAAAELGWTDGVPRRPTRCGSAGDRRHPASTSSASRSSDCPASRRVDRDVPFPVDRQQF
jgi:hypothetical protein